MGLGSATWAFNHVYVTKSPQKNSGHQGSGELTWLAVARMYCHTSLPRESTLPRPLLVEDSGRLCIWNFPRLYPMISSLG